MPSRAPEARLGVPFAAAATVATRIGLTVRGNWRDAATRRGSHGGGGARTPRAPDGADMEKVFFWVFALVAVVAAVNAVARRRPLACALSLVVSFVGLAGLYFQLHAPFPAVLQVMLYAGAIMVLVVFVIMFLNLPDDAWEEGSDVRKERLWPLLLVAPLAALLIGLVRSVELPQPKDVPASFGSVQEVGRTLFTTWVYPFELVSALLLAAVVGAVVVAKKRLN